MKTEGCIFDLDGTLADTQASLVKSVNQTLEKLSLPPISEAQCIGFVGNGAKMLVARSIAAAGGAPDLIDDAMEIYRDVFAKSCCFQVIPYEGMEEVLQAMQAKGIRMAVLSNKPHKETEVVISRVFGKDLFCFIQGQREDVPRKPDPTGVHMALEAMGVTPEACLYLGDSEVDMETGLAAGVTVLGAGWGFRDRAALAAAGASAVLHKPTELMAYIKGE